MQRICTIVCLAGSLLLGLLLVALWQQLNFDEVKLGGKEVLIASTGEVLQEGRVVGLALQEENIYTLKLNLAKPGEVAEVTGSLELVFPAKAEGIVTVIPTSIEGSEVISTTWVKDSRLRVTLVNALAEGYPTLIVSFPEDYLSPSPITQLLTSIIGISLAYWVVGCLVLLTIVFSYAYIRTRRIDFTSQGESLPEPPGDLKPIELALLHHGVVRPQDIASLFYSLAERGYLEIIDHGDDTEEVLFLRSKMDDGLATYEKNFLMLVFDQGMKPIKLSEVLASLNEELFSAVVSQVYVEVYDGFASRGFFRDTPRAIHLRYKTTGIILQFLGVFLAFFSLFGFVKVFPAILIIAGTLYVAGMLTFKVGYRVVPLSRLGWQLVSKSQAFVRFLRDREVFVWGIGPETDVFYRYVPYALVVDEVNAWYMRFKNHKRWDIPTWYTDINGIVVTPEKFVNQVTVVAQVLARAISEVKDPNVD
jgi:hypothetical protein